MLRCLIQVLWEEYVKIRQYSLQPAAAGRYLLSVRSQPLANMSNDYMTLIVNHSNTFINYTNMDYVVSKGTLDIYVSDHHPVYIIKKRNREPNKSSQFWGQSYVQYNKETFQADIRNHYGWDVYLTTGGNDPNILWARMLNIITEVVDIHCPNKRMKFRDDSPEWITKELVAELIHKDYLYAHAKITNAPSDWNKFQQKKNETKTLLQNAKEEFLKDKLETLKDNPRKFWRVLNEMSGIGKNKKRNSGCSKVEDQDGILYENMDAAEFMNKYYVNVGPSLAKDHNIQWDKAPDH